MQFFHNTNINFLGKRLMFLYISTAITIFGIIATFAIGVEYGIDFQGGTEVIMKFNVPTKTEDLRKLLSQADAKGAEVKSYGVEDQFILRLKEAEDTTKLKTELDKSQFASKYDVTGRTTIGPKIGSEMRMQAFIAVLLSVIAILLYVAFRFEFIFGLGAIVALIHDIIFTFTILLIVHNLGIMSLEIDGMILSAMLTVIGFSINDTVIVFDRIRENKEKYKGMPFYKLVNQSINETLSRTINTVLTVVMVLSIMVALGGPVLQGFSFTMLIGIIIGTYSSIYIASSFVIWYLESVKKEDVRGGENYTKKSIKTA